MSIYGQDEICLHFAAYARMMEAARVLEKREQCCLPDPIRRKQINQLKAFADCMLALTCNRCMTELKCSIEGFELNGQIDELWKQFEVENPLENFTDGEYVPPVVF